MRRSILPILFSIALLTSACCKEVCGDENVTFFYRNFTASEIDTVQYLFYVKDNLTTPADSMTMYYLGTNSTPQDFRNTVPVNLDRVIEVRIKSLGDTFRITDIQTDLADCNCSKGTFRQMKSFNIDGIRVIAREVEVIR